MQQFANLRISEFQLSIRCSLALAVCLVLTIVAPASGTGIDPELSAKKQHSPPKPLGGSRVFGKIERVSGPMIVLTLRSGKTLAVDLTVAAKNHLTVTPYVGEFVRVEGSRSPNGDLIAESMTRVKREPDQWDEDVH